MHELFLAARIALGAIFLMSALPKLMELSEFAVSVQKYRILPRFVARCYGLALPFVETGTGALLFLGLYTAWSGLASTLMILSFMIAVGIAIVRGQNLGKV